MNKIVIFAVMIIVASSSYVYSQDAGGGENIARPLDEVAQPADTDSKPVIYVHEDCPHCQDVEDFVAANDLGDMVQYMQLKDNEDNLTKLTDLWAEYNVPGDGPAWPIMFYVDSEGVSTYSLGSDPIIEVLAEKFNIDIPDEVVTPDQNSNSTLMIFGGLILAAIFGFGVVNIATGKKSK